MAHLRWLLSRWASGGDSPCAAQTRPPPTNPGRPPSSRCIDVLTESWCATLHQAVLAAASPAVARLFLGGAFAGPGGDRPRLVDDVGDVADVGDDGGVGWRCGIPDRGATLASDISSSSSKAPLTPLQAI